VGATEEQVTLLAEVDADAVDAALRDRRVPAHAADDDSATRAPALVARSTSPALAGSVFDRNGWGAVVNQLRERTVRRS
jgi:flagellar protein FliO/FliZ